MRNSGRCPKCSGHRFLRQPRFRIPDPQYANSTSEAPAATVDLQGFIGRRQTAGHLEAWSCFGCGYTELYAALPVADLERLAKKLPEQLEIVDHSPPTSGPHR